MHLSPESQPVQCSIFSYGKLAPSADGPIYNHEPYSLMTASADISDSLVETVMPPHLAPFVVTPADIAPTFRDGGAILVRPYPVGGSFQGMALMRFRYRSEAGEAVQGRYALYCQTILLEQAQWNRVRNRVFADLFQLILRPVPVGDRPNRRNHPLYSLDPPRDNILPSVPDLRALNNVIQSFYSGENCIIGADLCPSHTDFGRVMTLFFQLVPPGFTALWPTVSIGYAAREEADFIYHPDRPSRAQDFDMPEGLSMVARGGMSWHDLCHGAHQYFSQQRIKPSSDSTELRKLNALALNLWRFLCNPQVIDSTDTVAHVVSKAESSHEKPQQSLEPDLVTAMLKRAKEARNDFSCLQALAFEMTQLRIKVQGDAERTRRLNDVAWAFITGLIADTASPDRLAVDQAKTETRFSHTETLTRMKAKLQAQQIERAKANLGPIAQTKEVPT